MGQICARRRPDAEALYDPERVEPRPDMMRPNALLSFARDNDTTGICGLVALRCSPSYTNTMGQSALHIGAMWGSIDAVRVLIELRADVNLQNHMGGQRPLHAVAMGKGSLEKRTECAVLLIQGKADPKLPDRSGGLAENCTSEEELRSALGAVPLLLHRAVKTRNLAEFKIAIAQVTRGEVSGLTLHSYDAEGKTALHVAVAASWIEGVQTLLAMGAAVSAWDLNGQTPLHFAVCSGNFCISEMLLKHNAQVDVHDRNAEKDPRFSSRSFTEQEEYRTPLHYASELGCVPSIRVLLSARADPNAKESNLQTPLHLCLAAREDVDGLRQGSGVLISGVAERQELDGLFGSIVGASSVTGDPPMEQWPVLVEGAESEDVLLNAGNVNSTFDEALHLLLEAKADVNMGNQLRGESRTVLHQVVSTGDTNLVKIVLQARADVNRQDTKLRLSALHMAVRARKLDSVRLLIEAKADTHQLTGGGKTAAELASVNGGSAELLSLLGCTAQSTPAPVSPPTGLADLTPEQRANLFID